ncbi:MAG: hypothetical protein ACRDGM_09650, partial [bacterium]
MLVPSLDGRLPWRRRSGVQARSPPPLILFPGRLVHPAIIGVRDDLFLRVDRAEVKLDLFGL